MREKLIELLGNVYLPMTCGPDTIGEYRIPHKFKKEIADHLIASGVTIQKWIPVTERLPEESGEYLVYCGHYDGICVLYYEILKTKSKWRSKWKEVTHWMPLPEPPKGE